MDGEFIIPSDLCPLIASFMDDKTKRQMRLASTRWFNIIKYNNFVLYFTKKEDIPAIIDRLSKYSWPIELAFNKRKFHMTADLISHLPKLTNLRKLTEDKYTKSNYAAALDKWRLLSTLTNIEEWSLYHYLPSDMQPMFTKLTSWEESTWTAPIVTLLSNLDSLRLSAKSSNGLSTIPNPQKLTHLDVYYSGQDFSSEMFCPLTNLRKLELVTKYDTAVNMIAYLTALERYKLFDRTLPSFSANTHLTHLSLQGDNWSPSDAMTISNLSNLSVLSLDVNQDVEDVHYITCLTNLRTLKLYRFSTKYYSCLTHFTNLKTLIMQPHYSARLNGGAIEQLTQLEKFRFIGGSLFDFKDDEVPDLTHHTNLTYFHWAGRTCPNKILQSFKYLTNLESLRIKCEGYNINFLTDLTKLTNLVVDERVDSEDFWIDLAQLTNLQSLNLSYMDKDDRYLPLQKLTKLKIRNGSESLDGRHLTALKSLQKISYTGFASKRQDLTSLMPYLYCLKYTN